MDKQALIDGLNDDLAHELGAIILYTHQAATAAGGLGHELRELLQLEAADELKHAQFLADKIVMLGGTPTTQPAAMQVHTDSRAMAEYDLELERQAIRNYVEHSHLAGEVGEIGLKVRLEEMAADETDHLEELQRLLSE